MKVIVEVPMSYTRLYPYDYDPDTIPNVGDVFENRYIVKEKIIIDDTCTLVLKNNVSF